MPQIQGPSLLVEVSNAMVSLHKEQFGRGPTSARSHFAGGDVLVCVLETVLLPAEKKMAALGDPNRVRDARVSYQAATAKDFVSAVEAIVGRKVHAFASGLDVERDVVFETFFFERDQRDNGLAPEDVVRP
jgi:uncharacterized protein YbcI